MRPWMAALLLTTAGCATAPLRPPAQHFAGDPYDLTLHHDVIAGEVCGLDVDYAVSQHGDATVLLGPGTHRLEARELGGGAVRVTGVLGLAARRYPAIDVLIAPDRIVGHIGARELRLVADGDVYRGTYSFPEVALGGKTNAVGDMEVAGRDEMMRLPKPALAALVPSLMTCDRRGWARHAPQLFHPPIAVRFGGPVHYETTAAR